MKLPDADDWLQDLPPIDGSEGDDESSAENDVTEQDLEFPRSPDGKVRAPHEGTDDRPDDTLDIGEPIDIDEAADGVADGKADDDGSWNDHDVETDFVGDDSTSAADCGPEPEADDDGLDIADDAPRDDAPGSEYGEVGPTDAIESFLEGELPPIDADDGGDFEQELIREVDLANESEPERKLHPVDLSWREVETLPMPLPIEPEDTDATVLLDPEAHDAAMVITARRGVARAVSGRAVVPCNLWRELGGSAGALPSPEPFLAFLWSSGQRRVLWLATAGGRLLRGDRNVSRWEDRGPLPGSGFRTLTARPDGMVVALRCSAMQASLVWSTDQRSWTEQRLPLAAARYEKGRVWLAVSGSAIAVGHPSGVVLSRDDGRTFREVPGSAGAIAGVWAGDGTTAALVVALLHDHPPRLLLARTDERDLLEVVAQVDAGAGDHAAGADGHAAGDDAAAAAAVGDGADGHAAGDDAAAAAAVGDGADGHAVAAVARPAGPPALGLAWDAVRGLTWVWWNGRTTAWGPRSLQ